MYMIYKRNLRLPFVEVFDAPDILLSCARREQSTHAPQALELLNGKTSNELAAALCAAAAEGAQDHRGAHRLRLAAGGRPSAHRRLRRAARAASSWASKPDDPAKRERIRPGGFQPQRVSCT